MRVALALLLATALAACSRDAPRGPVVLAAASLQGALDEIGAEWDRRGYRTPVISYAGSQAVARQVEGGAPADIVVLADIEWMDMLVEHGRADGTTRRDLISNRLVVVRRTSGPPGAGLQRALAGNRIAMGDPDAVPAGRYARAALVTLGLWRSVEPRVIATDSVRAALVLAERGEVDAAIVYASDAAASNTVAIAAHVPPAAHPPIRYSAALLTKSENADAAGFLGFLASPDAARIFVRHGFVPLPRAAD